MAVDAAAKAEEAVEAKVAERAVEAVAKKAEAEEEEVVEDVVNY